MCKHHTQPTMSIFVKSETHHHHYIEHTSWAWWVTATLCWLPTMYSTLYSDWDPYHMFCVLLWSYFTWSVRERTRLAMRGDRLTSQSSSLGRAEGGLPVPEMLREEACSVMLSTQPCFPRGCVSRWGGGEVWGGAFEVALLRAFSKYFLIPSFRILSLFTIFPSLWREGGQTY